MTLKNNSDMVVVVAQAIKTHFWKEIYTTLHKEGVPFHLVFVGHNRPSFKLPANFTYIYCSLQASTCAEIAYRYAYAHLKEAKYIVNIADDLFIPDNFLSDTTKFYERCKKEHKNDLLLVGPLCLTSSGMENLIATHPGGPTLLGAAFTTVETSKKIGGIDKRFNGVFWDCDRMLRVHESGGTIIYASDKEINPTREVEHTPGLYVRHKNHDRVLLDGLWSYDDRGTDTVSCSALSKDDAEHEKRINIKRT